MYEDFLKPTITYCEENLLNSFITQPANSLSNLAFFVIGIYIYLINKKAKRKHLFLEFFGILVVILGLFSFIYHATYTFLGQILDLSSMFLLIAYLISFNLHRLHPKFYTLKFSFSLFILLSLLGISGVYFIKTLNGFNIGILIFIFYLLFAVFLLLELKIHRKFKPYNLRYLIIGFIIFGISHGIWFLDYMRVWCDPETFHFVNGHALWHIGSAISLIYFYKFYSHFYDKHLKKIKKNLF